MRRGIEGGKKKYREGSESVSKTVEADRRGMDVVSTGTGDWGVGEGEGGGEQARQPRGDEA